MGTLLVLAFLVLAAFLVLGAFAVIGFVVRTILRIVFFPIRILFKLVFWTLGAGLAALLMPLVLIALALFVIGGVLAALSALLAPLLPIALVALVGWAIYWGSTRGASRVA